MTKNFLLCVMCLVTPVLGQMNYVAGNTPVALSKPVFQVSTGYSYLFLDTPARQRVGLSGVDVTGFVDFNPRWGVLGESSYAHVNNILGTGHNGDVITLLTGPVFYPIVYGKTRIFGHTLLGASLEDSAVPVQGSYYLGGTITRFSYAMGGGVEQALGGRFALRVGSEYLRTTFANAKAGTQLQNNVRIVTSIVYRFGSR